MLFLLVLAMCVTRALVYLLLRLCMNLQSLEGFVLNVMDSRSCFQLNCCSCKMLSDISLFSISILFATFCEGSWRLRWFHVRIYV